MTSSHDGFSLTEVLVASALALLVLGGLVPIIHAATRISDVQPEAIDMAQRLRVGVDRLFGDLYSAGAGLDGGDEAWPLAAYAAPILPRRIGALKADAFDVARADTLSVLWVPDLAPQGVLAAATDGTVLAFDSASGCADGAPVCGLEKEMSAVVLDRSGRYDLFTVLEVGDTTARVRPRGSGAAAVYGAGASVSEVVARTYYLDSDARQLRQYDTDLTDSPVLDDVTRFHLTYFGTATMPVWPKPAPGEANCLYDVTGNRLSSATGTSPTGGSLVQLPIETFRDGPWCGTGDLRFDVDLLRIRRVRITLGVQASAEWLRGAGPGFGTAGTSRSAARWLPDMYATFDISPRNLGLLD